MITQQSYRIMIPGKSLFLRMITCQKSCGQSCVVNYNSEDFIQTNLLLDEIGSFKHDILLVYNYHNAVRLISYGFQTCVLMAHNQGGRLVVPETN